MNEVLSVVMGRFKRVIGRSVAELTHKIIGINFVLLTANDASYHLLILRVVSFHRRIITTLDFCTQCSFFGCFDPCDTVDGYDVVTSIYIYCNRVVSSFKFLETSIYSGDRLIGWVFLILLVLCFFKFGKLTM